VALARYQLAEQLAAHNAKLALMERLQEMLGEAAGQLDTLSRQLTEARDSLTRLSEMTEEESMRVRELIRSEAEAVRLDAADNARRADSLRASFGTILSADDAGLIEVERQTSLTYQQLANNVINGLPSVFARHPVVRLQDTVRAHIAATEGLVSDTRATISSTNAVLMNEMARLRATEDQRTGAARAALASAEAARATAEGAVLVAAEAELRARADMFLGMMSRDAQAAEFGAASASFFKAVGSPTASGTLAEPPGGAAGAPDQSSPR
jgi:cell division septum initiation protein DivIVA